MSCLREKKSLNRTDQAIGVRLVLQQTVTYRIIQLLRFNIQIFVENLTKSRSSSTTSESTRSNCFHPKTCNRTSARAYKTNDAQLFQLRQQRDRCWNDTLEVVLCKRPVSEISSRLRPQQQKKDTTLDAQMSESCQLTNKRWNRSRELISRKRPEKRTFNTSQPQSIPVSHS